MVRSKRTNSYYNDGKALVEFYGLADDTKPTEDVATGSVFFEVDTGAIYVYDEDGEDWIEFEGGSGEGGGEGGESDFSTAEVTIAGSLTDNSGKIFMPIISEYEGEDPYLENMVVENGTYNIVLYKGAATAYYVADLYNLVAVSGDAQYYEEEHGFIISGDCTITFSTSQPG